MFCVVEFPQHQRIAEYIGERITFAEAAADSARRARNVSATSARNGPLMESRWQRHSIHQSLVRAQRQSGVAQALFLYALREIEAGEEITAEYLYECGSMTQHVIAKRLLREERSSASPPLMQMAKELLESIWNHPS